MDIKILLQALNEPWMIFPPSAENLALAAHKLFIGTESTLSFGEDDNKNKVKEFAFIVNAKGERIGSIADAVDAGVAVINLKGAVMKYDYCGAPGTESIGRAISSANNNSSISAIVLQIDSPGGSVSGTQELANLVKNSSKPIVAYVNGMMCSAAMWIGSAASYRIASAETATIGSIGTMCSWLSAKNAYKQRGFDVHEVYATDSTHKNIQFREAEGSNADGVNNYEPMIKTWLDPLNNIFTRAIQKNLPNADKTVLNGSHYVATDAKKKGLIDDIGSFERAVNKALELSNEKQKIIQSQNNNDMKWSKFLALLGFTKAVTTAAEISLTDIQADSLESLVEERDFLKTQVTTLTGEKATITDQLTKANDTIANLRNEIIELGKADGSDKTETENKDGKDRSETVENDAMSMPFQKELLEKV